MTALSSESFLLGMQKGSLERKDPLTYVPQRKRELGPPTKSRTEQLWDQW